MTDDTLSPLSNVITIDDERIKSHLDRIVRGSVQNIRLGYCLAIASRFDLQCSADNVLPISCEGPLDVITVDRRSSVKSPVITRR